MRPVVTIIDYGRGNLLSVRRALEHCGAQTLFAHSPRDLQKTAALVLPGVGSFADGMARLRESGLDEAIRQKASDGVPLLGICLGMQMLFDTGYEDGETAGLGLIPGTVEPLPRLDTDGAPLRVPHVGWSGLYPSRTAGFAASPLADVQPGEEVYFVHSFAAHPSREADRLAYTLYGGHTVCAAVQRANVTGVQFHPEKSAKTGLGILQAFVRLAGAPALE